MNVHVGPFLRGRPLHLFPPFNKEALVVVRSRTPEYRRAYYEAHKAEFATYWQNYYAKNKERLLARNRAWREAHPEEVRAYKRAHYRPRTSTSLRKMRYGLTHEQVLSLFEASDGLCALCYEVPATTVDHDHESGEIRGALCNSCNTALGRLGDNVAGLQRAIEYLETVDVLL